MILFSFVYFMLTYTIHPDPLITSDFGITENEDELGFYCGLIASSFFFAQFCTSIFWGYMSDRYGRRPIILLGLCSTAITSTLFGLSKNLTWAILTRSLCGFMNANVGVAKSMLGELSDHTNQSQVFSIFGFAWGIGVIVGPALGGYLANPAKTFPDIFGNWDFFIRYPYFLPCFVAALVPVVGFVIGYFFLEETKGRKKNVRDGENQEDSNPWPNSAQDDHLEGTDTAYGSGQRLNELYQTSQPPIPEDAERQLLVTPSNIRNRQGQGHPSQYGSMTTQSPGSQNTPDQSNRKLPRLSIMTVVAYAIMALHSISFEEVYNLYALTPLISHGLGWTSIQLSNSLALMGFVQLFTQFVVYPELGRRFSAVWLFRISQLVYACVYIIFPIIRDFAVDEDDMEVGGQTSRVWYLILAALLVKNTSGVFAFTSVMVMITNASPSHLLGTANGIGQMSASFMRAFGPAMGGISWAWSLSNGLIFPFNYYFIFVVLSFISALGFFYSLFIPSDLRVKV
ncbi:hypothetical protein BGZ65_000019 [Modicella reniformis]|uniref:Major facilitator superfamily (MFS) profile domain-containing protein n=1 Tax=Modicella reniformis TaxID=1440133 RepID=A0A9P6J506_9FUNG|nr:hypothetical protein BGZ65_000019 [Modicella reniformis]